MNILAFLLVVLYVHCIRANVKRSINPPKAIRHKEERLGVRPLGYSDLFGKGCAVQASKPILISKVNCAKKDFFRRNIGQLLLFTIFGRSYSDHPNL